ncbi:RNA 2',3'-cyclic phosphodiesterase [Sinisalibacter aestuarii]|uniref:RNA 2',3'-cyclic phosphodiesterase n=1 Tax=Sinisalibacter aestuarii TaxID=2949426 RepID=A0ABQ5LUM0_9RHOB|nr:RNA 2',3'-cyclic phosphodiesterase [Sinisalibacter aestuarii]GKY88666.1 RNA 2',3'-cyclic phosphodiesterase [Sinisalibacter aestuarii]
MRAFLALDLPEAALAPIARLQAGLVVGKPVPEDNLHLTLAFLGDINDMQAAEIAGALSVLHLPPLELTLTGLDLFGGRRPSVLFVRAQAAGLEALHDKAARLAREAGVTLPRERFRPHVTIARFAREMTAKDQQKLGEFLALNATFALPPLPVATLTLYRSHLRHEGAIHEALAEATLGR